MIVIWFCFLLQCFALSLTWSLVHTSHAARPLAPGSLAPAQKQGKLFLAGPKVCGPGLQWASECLLQTRGGTRNPEEKNYPRATLVGKYILGQESEIVYTSLN